MLGHSLGDGAGVRGTSDGEGTGVAGQSDTGTGVTGKSRTGPAVEGTSITGRGGLFGGRLAQIQLMPGPGTTHPRSGNRGDLYADKNGRLWFCKTGGAKATWHQIA